MKRTLDRFILSLPLLFIKQFPYAWIAFVALWAWPPSFVSGALLLIIVIGLLMAKWQSAAWISKLRREHAPDGGKFHIDQPRFPLQRAARNVSILVAASGVLAFLLKGQFGLNSWQIFIMIVGFSLLYRDALFFGAPTTYVITASGIGVHFIPGHIDYRLFLNFKEISRIQRSEYQADRNWDFFARTRDVRDGLLLTSKDPKGFTKRLERLFIVPKDVEKFVEQLPHGYG